MPQFAWKGIGLDGLDQAGTTVARSVHQLDAVLLNQNIALLDAKVINPYSFLRPVPVAEITAFFDQLQTLIQAGVYLDAALEILAEQITHSSFKAVIKDVSASVQEGSQLHEAMEVYPDLFDAVMIQVVRSGQEAGNLPLALRSVAQYVSFKEQFRSTIKKVCMLPAITCVFFALVAVIIIGFIVPSFASLYQSAGKQLPETTQTLLTLSSWVSLSGAVILVPCFAMLYACSRMFKRCQSVVHTYQRMLFYTPIVGHIIWYGNVLAYMQALSLLTAGGVHVASALELAQGAVNNAHLKKTFSQVTDDVDQGMHVSLALSKHAFSICPPSILALVRVGEESGRLDRAFEQIGAVYQQRLEKMSTLVTTLVQPVLMIVLGLMITGLIFAVYVPIFNLSDVIS